MIADVVLIAIGWLAIAIVVGLIVGAFIGRCTPPRPTKEQIERWLR